MRRDWLLLNVWDICLTLLTKHLDNMLQNYKPKLICGTYGRLRFRKSPLVMFMFISRLKAAFRRCDQSLYHKRNQHVFLSQLIRNFESNLIFQISCDNKSFQYHFYCKISLLSHENREQKKQKRNALWLMTAQWWIVFRVRLQINKKQPIKKSRSVYAWDECLSLIRWMY